MNPLFNWIPKLWEWAWERRNARLAKKRKRDADRVRRPVFNSEEYAIKAEAKARRRKADALRAKLARDKAWERQAGAVWKDVDPNPYD
ncbi:MAG: hypothetical protein GY851_07565 [bacterium]|nr:hypothetical protein [bacterium]